MSLTTVVAVDANIIEPVVVKPVFLLNQLNIATPEQRSALLPELGTEAIYKASIRPKNIISLNIPTELITTGFSGQAEADEFAETLARAFSGTLDTGWADGDRWDYTIFSEADQLQIQLIAQQIRDAFPALSLTICNPA